MVLDATGVGYIFKAKMAMPWLRQPGQWVKYGIEALDTVSTRVWPTAMATPVLLESPEDYHHGGTRAEGRSN